MTVDLSSFVGKTVHFIGIGGSSMNGLALLMKSRGYHVRGSDRTASYVTEKLEKAGIDVVIGHFAQNVHGADLVVYTAAIAPDNVERVEAARLGIAQMERCELLGQISNAYGMSVAISGTHGKTTTTAMLAQVLTDAGVDPNIHIGGELDAIGGSVRTGQADVFVTEACEFNRSFLSLRPTMTVILNIDADHLDCYRDLDDIEATFLQFARLLPQDGLLLVCGDDARAMRVAQNAGREWKSFGFDENCWIQAVGLRQDDQICDCFDVLEDGQPLIRQLRLHVPGRHSVVDALAAIACARAIGVAPEAIAQSLACYRGAHRRFERTGVVDGVSLYHDYGHNPSEYKTVVPVAAAMKQRRLFVVFQPHTYSRAKALIDDFGPSFCGADEVLVTDIYAAREKDPGDINAQMLIQRMQGFGYRTVYTPDFDACVRYLKSNWQPGDLVLTVGCGNINLLNDLLTKE